MDPQAEPKEPVSKHLLVLLRIFGLIFLVMLGFLIYDIVQDLVSLPLALVGLALGVVIGVIVSRMYRLSYDEEERQVAGRIDWVGGVILVLYLVFVFSRNQLFSSWVGATSLAAFALSVAAGTMLGRLIGTSRGIRRVLEAWGLSAVRAD